MIEKIISNKENNVYGDNNKIHIIKENIKEKDSNQKLKQYEYQYSYDYLKLNNNKNQKEISKFNNLNNKNETPNVNKKIYINSNYLEESGNSPSKNRLNQSSQKQKYNCETNYSINNISNVRYINGSNKIFSEINYIRNQDLEFISKENIEKKQNIKNGKKNGLECGQKYTFDKISNCSSINLGFASPLVKNDKIMKLKNENINNLNYKGKIVKRKYFINNLNTKKNIKRLGRNLNVEILPLFFSDEDIFLDKSPNLITKKNNSKYYFTKNKDNKNLRNSFSYSGNFNIFKDINKKRNYNMNINKINNTKNIKNIYNFRDNNNSTKNNHIFKSINYCSSKNKNSSKNDNKSVSSDKNKTNNKYKYKYNICICNIDVNKGLNHSVSYEKEKNKKECVSNRHSLKDYSKKYNLLRNNQNNDSNDIKSINAQNFKVKEDKKTFKNLVPITINKIEYSFDLKNSVSDSKVNNSKDIYDIGKINQNTENLNDNQKEKNNNIKNHTIIQSNLKKIKKPNWNQTNKVIKPNSISFENNNKIVNKEQIIPIKNKEKNILNTEKIEINITDNKKNTEGEIFIERNSIESEKKEKEIEKEIEKEKDIVKDKHSNLLLSSSQGKEKKIKLNYPQNDWKNIIKPTSESPLSIEGKNKNSLLKKNVEKKLIKRNKSKNDLNIINNKKKEVIKNINNKKEEKKNLFIEEGQPFENKDKKNSFDIKNKKEKEKILITRDFLKILENNKNEDEILFNDDYNIIEQNYSRPVKANIRQIKEISDKSNSNRQFKDYNKILNNSINSYEKKDDNIYINNISEKIPNKNEFIKEKKERKNNNEYKNKDINLNQIKNKINSENSNKTPQNLYLKKKINSHSTILKEYKKGNEEKENILSTQYFYREIITNIQSEIINENEKESPKDLNKSEIFKQKNENNSENSSPKSLTKYCYRE